MADSTDNIHDAISQPKKASGDGQSMEMHSLPDQIAADRYVREQKAANSRKLPIRTAKIKPGGAI